MRIANIGLGDTVVVVGVGLVGRLIAQLVRIQGGVVTVGCLQMLESARTLRPCAIDLDGLLD